MPVNTYKDPLFIQWNVDGMGNKISVERLNEEYIVAGNKIVLREIPDYGYGVEISGKIELRGISTNAVISNANEFKVDYATGIITVHESLDAELIVVDRYFGRGAIYTPASRVWTKIADGEIVETLQSFIDAGEDALEGLDELADTILAAETATQNAQDAADDLNNFIHLGAYSAGTTYVPRNVVTHLGSSYMCILQSTGNIPTNTTYWRLVALAGDMQKSTYDQNNSGIVDMSEDSQRLGGQLPAHYATASNLTNHVNNRIDLAAIHGLRVVSGQLQYYDGDSWEGVSGSVPPEVLAHLEDMIYDLEVHGIRVNAGVLEYYNTDTSQWIEVQGGGGGGTGFVWNKNSYTTVAETNSVPIGITGFNSASHYLTVYQNSTFIEEGQDYQIINDTHIEKLSGNWDIGTLFNFRVIQSINYDENLDAMVKKQEEFVATEGQTVFNLTEGSYIVGANALSVFVDGMKQPNSSFVETNTTSFTMNDGLTAGDSVVAEWYEFVNVSGLLADANNKIGILSNLDTSNTSTLVDAINELVARIEVLEGM